jgi:hypothetical protein
MGGTRFPGGYAPYPHLTVSGSKVWAPCPHPPRESHGCGEDESPCAPGTFSETPDVGRMLLATYHKQTHNINPNISRQMLHGRRFATWDNVFCNIAKVFRNIPCTSHPDRRLTGPFIRIVQRNTRPTLALGSDVRALAVPLILTLTMLLCLAMYTLRKTCFPFVLGHTMHPMRLHCRPTTTYHYLCLAMSPHAGLPYRATQSWTFLRRRQPLPPHRRKMLNLGATSPTRHMRTTPRTMTS